MTQKTKTKVAKKLSPKIIARIGYEQYCFSSLSEAEKLLELISKAQPISFNNKLPAQKKYHKTKKSGDIEVSLVYTEILEETEAKELAEAIKTAV